MLIESVIQSSEFKDPCDNNEVDDDQTVELIEFYNIVVTKAVDVSNSEIELPSSLKNLINLLSLQKSALCHENRTATLWLQYMYYIQILKDFVLAERTCDWYLHLFTALKMLNLLAATAHRNSAKSLRLYLQIMNNRAVSHPWLHEQRCSNYMNAIRRSKRFWAGISTKPDHRAGAHESSKSERCVNRW